MRCFQCGIGLKDFSNLDDPLKEHVKHSDNCQFLVQFYGSREAVMAQKVNPARIGTVCGVLAGFNRPVMLEWSISLSGDYVITVTSSFTS